MKGLAAAALAIAIALPVCAQRGGGHASFAGHGAPAARPAPAFHGSYAPAGQYHYSGIPIAGAAPMAHSPVAYPTSLRLMPPGVRYPTTAPVMRPTFYHPGHGTTVTTTHFYINTYPVGYVYPSYVVGYLPPDMLDDSYDNFGASQQPVPDNGYYPQAAPPEAAYGSPQPAPQPEDGYPQPAQAYPAYPEPQPAPGYQGYAPQPAPAAPQIQYVPGSASNVILIFKDGRPPEQIQNYLATRTTLTVLDGGRRHDIPISDLDVPATVSANRQTGVDFQLPGTPQ